MKKSFVSEQINTLPIVAILRGVEPDEALSIGIALYEAGIRVMEVTMNSNKPLESIKILASHFQGKMAVGAGTVLTTEQVSEVYDIGGSFIVSPNTNAKVIEKTAQLGIYSLPGAATCSECFQAIDAGADALKIFPASVVGAGGIKDLTAVIPKNIPIFAVGGVTDNNMNDWFAAGAAGVGLGSNIYQAGDNAEVTSRKAQAMVAAYEIAVTK
ncbi:MAG: 2-dehydro-3-deoxy-6-phosphogalactonate aldolase [Akkermansiaceae bacterium]